MAVTKVINSESKAYKPVLVDSLVLDAAPTVGSLNGVTSDGVAKAISGSGSVPTPAAGDDGKVLTANDGAFGWSDPTGTEYSAGTGITISEENAIAVTEAISNGAAAGATAVQPAALNDYALSSSLATVATTGAYSDLSGTPTIPTVDQSYSAVSTNAQSGVAVAEAIAGISVDEVPTVGNTDGGKVLTASYSGGQGSYSWQTAQGGGSTYTAGDGIDITANSVSVKAGTGLEIDDVSETVQQNLTCSGIYEFNSSYHAWDICPLTQDIYDAMNTTNGFTLTLSKEVGGYENGFYLALATPIDEYRSYSHSSGYAILGNKITTSAGTTVSYGFPVGTSFTFKLSDYNSSKSNRTLEQVAASISSYHVVLILDAYGEFIASDALLAGNSPEVIATCEATTTITDALCVSNPLPASTSLDEDKVLTVDSNGDAVWATPQGGGASYTAGNGIRIDANDEISVKVSGDHFSVGEYTTSTINNSDISISGKYMPTKLKTIAQTFACSEVPSEVKAVIVLYKSSSNYAVYDTDTVIGSYSDGNITYTNNVVLNLPTDSSEWTWTGSSIDVSDKIPSSWYYMYVCAKGSTGSYAGLKNLPLKSGSDFAFNVNVPYLTILRPLPTPGITYGKVLTTYGNYTYGWSELNLPLWSSDYGASVNNSTHKINVTAITPADKQIKVLGNTDVMDMTLNLVNPKLVPNMTTLTAKDVVPDSWGGSMWRSNELSSSSYPGLDHGTAVTLCLNIPNDVVLTGSYSGATLSSTLGIYAFDSKMKNEINITSSIIDSSNILKIPAGRYDVTMNMSQVYGYSGAMLLLSVGSWLESGGTQVDLDAADKTLISTAMADWTFDWPLDSGLHYEMGITAIPSFSSADAGKVLQVQNDGTLAWVTLS